LSPWSDLAFSAWRGHDKRYGVASREGVLERLIELRFFREGPSGAAIDAFRSQRLGHFLLFKKPQVGFFAIARICRRGRFARAFRFEASFCGFVPGTFAWRHDRVLPVA